MITKLLQFYFSSHSTGLLFPQGVPFSLQMGTMGEDLASRLRRVLYQHQAELESAATLSDLSSSPDSSCSTEETLSYISKMLMDDDDEEDEIEVQQHSQEMYQGMLEELSTIVSPSTSPGDSQGVPPRYEVRESSVDSCLVAKGGGVDLYWTLMQCARAIAANNSSGFFAMANELKSRVLYPRSPLEKVVVLFLDALIARSRGTGAQTYRAMAAGISTRRLLSVHMLNLPGFCVTHIFANEMILRACRGARRVHIVDYGIFCGYQWPPLIKALATRPEGPPQLKITGIDFSHVNEASQAEKRLVDYAKSAGVHLEYHSIVSDLWEYAQPVVHPSEVLIVNSNLRLRHTRADFLGVNNPRMLLFEKIYRMKPAMFVQCVCSLGLSSPFFLPRVEEAFKYYHAKLEYYDTWMGDQLEDRGFLEKVLAKTIMNIVACEGLDMVERADTYKRWDFRAKKAGFQQVPLDDEVYENVRTAWGRHKHTSENFSCGRDENWMLLGWKDLVMTGMSAWKPGPKIK